MVDHRGIWHAALTSSVEGNPTGAGDAVTAALVAGLTNRPQLKNLLPFMVAAGAAAVMEPLAGSVDPARIADFESHVEVQELT